MISCLKGAVGLANRVHGERMTGEISRHNLPPIHELAKICGGEGTQGDQEPHDLRRLYARAVRKLSIRITRVLLPTGVSANQTTVGGIGIGILGAALLAVNAFWAQILAIILLQLAFVLDFCDGEIARFEREIEGKSSGAGGAYLDWVGHYYIPAVMAGALGWAVFHETGHGFWLAIALVVILSLVRVPYSARDHIMWGIYRDQPESRGSEAMVRAAFARQGGDPEKLNLEASAAERMAGGEGSGILWSRYTNLGQLIVFPGFISLVAVASIFDMVYSAGDGRVDEVVARGILLALLGAMHLLHQLRAIAQGFRVTRSL